MSKNDNIPSVDITIGANMYGRISDLPNTPSHVLAEFVDNAIQSYIDNKESLLGIDPEYKLHVDINLQFSAENHGHASVIVVKDNAAGISRDKFSDGKVTIRPSIGCFESPCNSHFFITENHIDWV